jgi:hypothetical protein
MHEVALVSRGVRAEEGCTKSAEPMAKSVAFRMTTMMQFRRIRSPNVSTSVFCCTLSAVLSQQKGQVSHQTKSIYEGRPHLR